jgi:hypothetical protein
LDNLPPPDVVTKRLLRTHQREFNNAVKAQHALEVEKLTANFKREVAEVKASERAKTTNLKRKFTERLEKENDSAAKKHHRERENMAHAADTLIKTKKKHQQKLAQVAADNNAKISYLQEKTQYQSATNRQLEQQLQEQRQENRKRRSTREPGGSPRSCY